MTNTDFINLIINDLMARQKNGRGIVQASAMAYIRVLKKLHDDDEDINDLKFLLKTDIILSMIKELKTLNTQKMYLSSLNSILSLDRFNKPEYIKARKIYFNKMMELARIHNDNEKENKKNSKQNENWIELKEIENKRDELNEIVLKYNQKKISKKYYNILLQALILSLFTLNPQPRRNKDYLEMYITYEKDPKDTTKNYLVLKPNYERFIFNVYKTASKYGKQEFKLENEMLIDIIFKYLKYHPLEPLKNKKELMPFLMYQNKSPFIVNSITRLLNKIFNNKLSSSLLRHIKATETNGELIEQLKKDANDMGHSLKEHIEYIKL